MVEGLQEVVTAAVQAAGVVLVAVAGKFVRDAWLRRLVNDVIERGIAFAIESLERVDWRSVTTRNRLVDLAAGYVVRMIPGTLRTFGITTERLRDMVTARLLPHDKAPGDWTGGAEGQWPAAADETPAPLTGAPRKRNKGA